MDRAHGGRRLPPDRIVDQIALDGAHPETTLDCHAARSGFREVRVFAAHDPDPVWPPTDNPALPTRKAVLRPAGAACRCGFSLDLIVNPAQLPQVAPLAHRFPELTIIVNHLGHPRCGALVAATERAEGVLATAAEPGVVLKLSGLWTVHPAWHPARLAPFLRQAVAAFGAAGCMFGSTLPVENLMPKPADQIPRPRGALWLAGIAARDDILRRTAPRVYRL